MGKRVNRYRLYFGGSKIVGSLNRCLCDESTDKAIAERLLINAGLYLTAESMGKGEYDGDFRLKQIY